MEEGLDMRLLRRRIQCRQLLLSGLAASGLSGGRVSTAIARPPPLVASGGGQFTELEPREDVSTFLLQRFDGQKRALASYRGRAVLLAFWASWCPPCVRELPILHRLQKQKDVGFAIVPVSLDRSAAIAGRFIDKLGLRGFDSFIDPEGDLASGPGSAVQTPFQLYGMPMSYVIDSRGLSAGYLTGAADWSAPDAIRLMRHYAG